MTDNYWRTVREAIAAIRTPVKKHTFRLKVHTRGTWGTVNTCDRAGHDHDPQSCLAYLANQRVRWHNSGHFGDAHMRVRCTEGTLPVQREGTTV